MPPTRLHPCARRLPLAAACLSLALLVAPAALAQSGGGGREIAPTTGATVPGASARGTGDTPRERVLDRLREADLTRSPEQEREQLRDLNALSRELAPSAPVPAPRVEEEGAARDTRR